MFESRKLGDVVVLTPRKNLVGGEETMALLDAIGARGEGNAPKVILDLQRINWVSSLGIEALRRTHRTCAGAGGWLRLAHVGARIRNVLLTMRLHWVFETFDTVEEAVAAPAAPSRFPRSDSPPAVHHSLRSN
jgi:anti-anti-sigma factor